MQIPTNLDWKFWAYGSDKVTDIIEPGTMKSDVKQNKNACGMIDFDAKKHSYFLNE